MKKIVLIIAIGVLFLFSPKNSEAFINFGFEMGDLTGWTVYGYGNAEVVESHYSPGLWDTTYYAQEGRKFLSLQVTGDYVGIWQGFSLNAGQIVDGMAAFDLCDIFNDYSFVRMYDASGQVISYPWFESRNTLGFPYMDGPWTYWSWTAPYSGTFYLEYYVENIWDTYGDSYGLFDAYVRQTVAPEPATMILFGSGLLGLAGFRRRKRTQ